MKVDADFYRCLLAANETAFSQGLFKMAYHMLSAALHAAIYLEDEAKLAEVEQIINAQHQQIKQHCQDKTFEERPCEVELYHSLSQIAHSHLLLRTTPRS